MGGMHTFLWHDYETFGTDPRRDRPAQFAAIRTDAELNEIGEPLELFCQPSLDYLPDPQSCLITGITPQIAFQRGVPEHEFAKQIHSAFSQPGTIGVGYNTIRFDDEFTRHLFWRNLFDPYSREWRNGNARWDLLDVVRMTYALRPDGIQWPVGADGKTSFKLELLSQANGLQHDAAHDALSDVRATIALARLLKQQQPRLFDFAFKLRDKRAVSDELGWPVDARAARPFVHVSGMFPVEQGCMAVMWPLTSHPTNRNEVIAWDLAHDPSQLLDLSAEQVRLRLFSKQADLPEGLQRLPIKSIHINKSPMVAGNLKVLTPSVVERWNINSGTLEQNASKAAALPDLSHLWKEVYTRDAVDIVDADPEQNLYGGFVGDADRRQLDELRELTPQGLAQARVHFSDPRLPEIVWRYRARNFPQTLSQEDQARWQQHRVDVLLNGCNGNRSATQVMAQIDHLSEEANDRQQDILGSLYDWADTIVPDA